MLSTRNEEKNKNPVFQGVILLRGSFYNPLGILFIFSLFCEYVYLEYVCIHVIYRINQAEYGILIFIFLWLRHWNK